MSDLGLFREADGQNEEVSEAVREFTAITQHCTCQQLVEWLGQHVTGAAPRMEAERKEWTNLSSRIEEMGSMEEQLAKDKGTDPGTRGGTKEGPGPTSHPVSGIVHITTSRRIKSAQIQQNWSQNPLYRLQLSR